MELAHRFSYHRAASRRLECCRLCAGYIQNGRSEVFSPVPEEDLLELEPVYRQSVSQDFLHVRLLGLHLGHRALLAADRDGRPGQAPAGLGYREWNVPGDDGGPPGHRAPGALDEESRPFGAEW